MKHLIPGRQGVADFDAKADYPEDVARLVAVAAAAGYRLSGDHAAELWHGYTDALCANWLSRAGEDDAALLRALLESAEVID